MPAEDALPDEPLTAAEYEELTKKLVGLLASHFGAITTRLERNVTIDGRSGPNQIDVIWEGPIGDEVQRFVFECRHYKSPIKRAALHAFRSIVDDIGAEMPTTGLMVTRTGYQSGAIQVADTYDIIVIELHEPTQQDTTGRLLQINFSMTMRFPVVTDVRYDFVQGEYLDEFVPPEIMLVDAGAGPVPLFAVLAQGEMSPVGQPPAAPHPVTKEFNPPAALVFDDEQSVHVTAIHATVGEADHTTNRKIGPGEEGLAWVAKDALGGTRAWFAKNGRVWVTDQ